MTVLMEEVVLHLSNTGKPVQLVKHIDEVPESKLKWPAIAEVKEDGVYCLLVVVDGKRKLFTRTGKPMYYEEMDDTLNVLCTRQGYAYITELVNYNISLETLSGLVNPNRVNPWSDDEFNLMMRGAKLVYHDVISVEDLIKGESNVPFVDRRNVLYDHIQPNQLVLSTPVKSMLEFDTFVVGCITANGEGAVLKQLDTPWVAGHKGFHVTKRVRGIHVDLRCTGVKYGKPGKHQHWIAALEFEYKGKKFWADLGKGWDNNKRDYLTKGYEKNRYNVIGQVFHVKALQESSKGVLRLPKVAEHRMDKEEQD